MIKVIINGADGKMGRAAVVTLQKEPGFELVAQLGSRDNLASTIALLKPDIVIDLTIASVAYENARTIIDANVKPVIGTTGFKADQIKELQSLCAQKKLGGIIAPNFSIGAVLAMKFAKEAARYFPQVEIIEMHHDGKEDAPSGTSIKTADMIAEQRAFSEPKSQRETLTGSRGALHHGIPIHAVRLPGLVAKEDIIFGGVGETLTIQHNTLDRTAFMQGIVLSCKKVLQLNELIYGLENII